MCDPPNVNVNGVVYSDGQLAVGAACIPPLVEIFNRSCGRVSLAWVNHADFSDAAADALFTSAQNTLSLDVGTLGLVLHLYPSRGFARSVLFVASEASGLDAFVLYFSADVGYFFQQLPSHWVLDPSTGTTWVRSEDPFVHRNALSQGTAYVLHCGGNRQPAWNNCVLFPAALVPSAPPARPSCSESCFS